MRPLRRLLAVALVLWWAAFAPAAVADDEGGAGGTSDAYLNDANEPTARAREVVDRGGRSAGSGASSCEWRLVNADDNAFAMYDTDGTRLHSDTGRWFEKWCDGQQVIVNGSFAVPERDRRVDPGALARDAVKSVSVAAPPIRTSPVADRQLYARVHTWLWVDPSWWSGYSATAEAGGVTTTVVATPVRAVWSTGDGSRDVVCEGPGVEWRSGLRDSDTYCSHLYTHSSAGAPGGVYALTVTVEFAVSWSSNLGTGGTLPPISRSASRSVVVGEIQAAESA